MLLVVRSLLLAGFIFASASAQQATTSQSAPQASPGIVANDALMLLAQHQAAVGGVDIEGLQASGTIAFAGSTAQLPATLVIAGSSFVRVQVANSNRLVGFAAKGSLHKSYYADGTSAIDGVGSGPASICSFQLLRTADAAARLQSLTKDGVNADGQRYDRLQAKQALTGSPLSAKSKAVAVDYFFDPGTHFLAKSSTMLHIPGILNAIPLETTYSDYRSSGTAMVPFKISQTLNGRPDWVLTLTSVSLLSKLDSSLTSF